MLKVVAPGVTIRSVSVITTASTEMSYVVVWVVPSSVYLNEANLFGPLPLKVENKKCYLKHFLAFSKSLLKVILKFLLLKMLIN